MQVHATRQFTNFCNSIWVAGHAHLFPSHTTWVPMLSQWQMINKAAQCWVAAPDDVLSLQLGQLLAGSHQATSLFLEHSADKVQILSQYESCQYMCIRLLVTSLFLEHSTDKVRILSQCECCQYMCIRHLVTSLFLEHFADKVQIMSQCECCQYTWIRWRACEAWEYRAEYRAMTRDSLAVNNLSSFDLASVSLWALLKIGFKILFEVWLDYVGSSAKFWLDQVGSSAKFYDDGRAPSWTIHGHGNEGID